MLKIMLWLNLFSTVWTLIPDLSSFWSENINWKRKLQNLLDLPKVIQQSNTSPSDMFSGLDVKQSLQTILEYWSEDRLRKSFRKQRQQHNKCQCDEAAMVLRHCIQDLLYLCNMIAKEAHLNLPRHLLQARNVCKRIRCTQCMEEIKYRCINDKSCLKYSMPLSSQSCMSCQQPTESYCFFCQEAKTDVITIEPACIRGIVYSAQFLTREEQTALENGFAGKDSVQKWLSVLAYGRENYLHLQKKYCGVISSVTGVPNVKSKQVDSLVQYKTARKSDGRVLTVEVQAPFEICCFMRTNDKECYVKALDVVLDWRTFLKEWQKFFDDMSDSLSNGLPPAVWFLTFLRWNWMLSKECVVQCM